MRTRLAVVAAAAAVVATGAVAAPAQAATARYYNSDETVQIVQNLLNGATVGSVTCGITAVVNKMKKFKGRAGLASIAAYSGEISAKTAGTAATCKLAKQLALAAAWTATVGRDGASVYIEDNTHTDNCGIVSKKVTFSYRIGPSPDRTVPFSGSVKVPC
ncbi:hypothetical protein M1L60_04155 [Actinoplanes sp. TRM 88003]|uniref:Uncharacterized protein n=1 Tax=Paractinoplanes aksuensis TaxID=2939490 RepID=A0ABT1DG16_9ACTN|nr:hypothetical protein [Actinoplanes aksuensis]MCO8269784.1 hypothetical protein [Actinoplanes aksuensis]